MPNQNTIAIRGKLYPIVEKSLQKNEAKYKKCVARFIQKRATSLYDTGPNDRIYFGANDLKDFYTSIGITEQEIISCLQGTFYWDIPFKPKAAKDPFTCALMMVIRYYLMKGGKQKDLELSTIYLAFSGKFYPSLHYNSFRIPPSENRTVMDYVINNKLSNKFDLKKEKSVFGAIKSICNTWLDTYKGKIKSASDEDVAYCIEQLHNRIKAFMINIAKVFYECYENKEYLNFESDSYDEDNFHLADSDSNRAEKFAEKAMNEIVSNGVNYKFCGMCADQNIKKDEIKFIIESITSDNKNLAELKELIQLLISDYMANSENKDIRGYDFIVYSIKAKPNAKDANVLRQKEIITNWLNENSPQYRKRKSRIATANSYYKAILQYIVLTISESNK